MYQTQIFALEPHHISQELMFTVIAVQERWKFSKKTGENRGNTFFEMKGRSSSHVEDRVSEEGTFSGEI